MVLREEREGPIAALARCVAALALLLVALLAAAGPVQAAFGIKSAGSVFTDPSGEATAVLPAGAHPRTWSTTLAFNTVGPPGEERPDGALRNLTIDLPAGLVGAAALLPACSRIEFIAEACPAATAVGSLTFVTSILGGLPPAPVYLLDPPPGIAAQLGLHAQQVPVTIDLSIAPAPPHNLVARVTNASQVADLSALELTLEGMPGGIAFLTLPRSCPAHLATELTAEPWLPPTPPVSAGSAEPQQTATCAALPYSPRLRAAPSADDAAAPSGLVLDLGAPDPGIASPSGRAAADTAAAVLELPPGMAVNPPVAYRLAGCTATDLARKQAEAGPGTGCPEAAKIGTAAVTTPLFADPIAGDLYVAEPDDPTTAAPGAENPFDSLLALYLILRDPERGVLLSLPVRIDADTQTGRLTAHLDRIPELPISHFSLRLNSGPRAPLVTPPGCGSHAIAYSLTPSSGNPPLEGQSTFETTSICGLAFAPELSAGTVSSSAGSASPLVLDLRNGAGAPNLDALQLTLPPGLGADLAAAATCPEADAATAACPAASRLGFARIALGAGPEPLWVPGGAEPASDVFLAGSYRGAPFSLLVSVPGTAGPFDLGRFVIRAAVRIDPDTAQVSVALGDLPQIRDGIPLHYRAIRLVLDRPGFVRNPTSCEPERVGLTATAANGAVATTSARFQAADCGTLRFRPRLAVALSGGLGRNGHPRVEASVASRPGEANLGAASVDLPAGELLDFRRIRALCPRNLAPVRCPAASRLGHATIRSPLLPEPLGGAIHLRSPSGRYPDLVAELEGGGVRILLRGSTASAPGGRLRIRLAGLPDIPLSRASISLAGGRRGIVVNSASLCGRSPRAKALLSGHNGRQLRLQPRIRLQSRC